MLLTVQNVEQTDICSAAGYSGAMLKSTGLCKKQTAKRRRFASQLRYAYNKEVY